MGHHISAVVLRGSFDERQALAFDLKPIPLFDGLTLFPLDARYPDFWSQKLQVHGFASSTPLLNSRVVHYMINSIANDPLFALIETDYCGGVGCEAAVAYRGTKQIMVPDSTDVERIGGSVGPVNKALRMLGVISKDGSDEFDTLELGRYRDFSDLFEEYDIDSGNQKQ